MERPTRLMLVDYDAAVSRYLAEGVEKLGLEATRCASGEEALSLLGGGREVVDAVACDLALASRGEPALIERLLRPRGGPPVLLMTGLATFDGALAALREGASDALVTPVEPQGLARAAERARQAHRLEQRAAGARPSLQVPLLGESPPMRRVLELVRVVAPTDAVVLISGAPGAEREQVARALHAQSSRAAAPFVALDVRGAPSEQLERALFDPTDGLSGARGGTLLLDEVCALPVEVQAKLLRALWQRTPRPGDAPRAPPLNVRLLVATSRDLEAEVRAHRFSEDLLSWLSAARIELPPLRARGGDVLLLARHLLALAARLGGAPAKGLTAAAAARLQAWSWPGDVRELERCVLGAAATARCDEVGVDDLPERLRAGYGGRVMPLVDTAEALVSLVELERRYTARVLASVEGNKTRAAHILGVDRRTLYRMLRRAARAG